MTIKNLISHSSAWSAAVVSLVALLSGCASDFRATQAPIAVTGAALKGSVHGGQQPVAFASLALYAAVTTGYGGTTTNLLPANTATDANGDFSITGLYSCTAGQQMYLVATGGNPGAGTNANLALMAAVGDCSAISSSEFISVNEITTVGSVFALAPFMSGLATLGTDPTNTSGLVHAFGSVNKLVNVNLGSATGNALPAGAVAPSSEINTLADILATCINSTGGVAGDTSPCGSLFTLTTPLSGPAPTDTIEAILNIAHNPTHNVEALYDLAVPASPFIPQLATAPNDWTLAITYSGGSFATPKTTTLDSGGNIWVANAANNSISVLAQSGTPVTGSPFTGNGLNAPAAIAIDAGGDAWVANAGGNTVSAFTSSGGVYSGSPFGGSGTISAPSSIAIDAPGNIWIANKGNSSVTELTGTGAYVQQVSTGITTPSSLTINPR